MHIFDGRKFKISISKLWQERYVVGIGSHCQSWIDKRANMRI
jgi:hypothetical protein